MTMQCSGWLLLRVTTLRREVYYIAAVKSEQRWGLPLLINGNTEPWPISGG